MIRFWIRIKYICGAGSNSSSEWSNWAPVSLLDWGQDAGPCLVHSWGVGLGFTGIVWFACLIASVKAKCVDGWNSILVAFIWNWKLLSWMGPRHGCVQHVLNWYLVPCGYGPWTLYSHVKTRVAVIVASIIVVCSRFQTQCTLYLYLVQYYAIPFTVFVVLWLC